MLLKNQERANFFAFKKPRAIQLRRVTGRAVVLLDAGSDEWMLALGRKFSN